MDVNNIGIIQFGEGVYTGEVEGGMANGFGRMIYHDGSVYLGEWHDNCQTGVGAMSTPHFTALGSFSYGMRHGKCICSEGDGRSRSFYIGYYTSDVKSGEGVLVNHDGSKIYSGEFSDDLPNGKGYLGEDLRFNGGAFYEGNFADGELSGRYMRHGVTEFAGKGGTFHGEVTGNLKHYFGMGAWVYDKAYATVELGYHNELDGDRLSYNFRGVKVYKNDGKGISLDEGDWGTNTLEKDGGDFCKLYLNGNMYMGEFADNKRSGNGVYAEFSGGKLVGLTVKRGGIRYVISSSFEILTRGKFSGDEPYDGARFYDNGEAAVYRGKGVRPQMFGVDYARLSGQLNRGMVMRSEPPRAAAFGSGQGFSESATDSEPTYWEEPTQSSYQPSAESSYSSSSSSDYEPSYEPAYVPAVRDYGDGYGEVLTFREKLQLQLEERKAQKAAKAEKKNPGAAVATPEKPEASKPQPAKKPRGQNETIKKLNEEYKFADNRSILYAVKIKKEEHIIPPTVDRLEEEAFSGNTVVKRIVFGKDLTYVRSRAFAGCTSLEVVDMRKSRVLKLYSETFLDCKNLKTVYLPRMGYTFFDGEKIFDGCPDDLTFIDAEGNKYDLEAYKKLLTTAKPNILVKYSRYDSIEKDRRIIRQEKRNPTNDIFETMEYKSKLFRAVKLKKSMKRIVIPKVIDSISPQALANNPILEELHIHDTVILEAGAFAKCTMLKVVNFNCAEGNSISMSDRLLEYCTRLKSVTCNGVICTIGYRTFANCTSLKKIDLKVLAIYPFAFQSCFALEEVNIPKIVYLNHNVFANCYNLKKVTVQKGCRIEKDAFPKELKVTKTEDGDQLILTLSKKVPLLKKILNVFKKRKKR